MRRTRSSPSPTPPSPAGRRGGGRAPGAASTRKKGSKTRSRRCDGIGRPPFVTRTAATGRADAPGPASSRRATSADIGDPPPCRRAFSSRLRTSRRSRRSTPDALTGSPPTSAPTRAPSSARRASRSTGSASPSDSGASSRAAVSSSSISSSSSAMSRSMLARRAGSPSSSSIAIRIRVSGVRSSCDAPARMCRCAPTSRSMRSAARLKLSASRATSSRPSTSTRAESEPAPSSSTRACNRSIRRVSPRASGHTPTAIATASRASGPIQSGSQWGSQRGSHRLHAGANLLRAAIQRPSSRRMTMGRGWPRAWSGNADSRRPRQRGGDTGGPTAATSRRAASYRVRSMRKRAARASRDARTAAASAPGGGTARVRRCTNPERRPGRSLKSSSKTARPIQAAPPASTANETRTARNPR